VRRCGVPATELTEQLDLIPLGEGMKVNTREPRSARGLKETINQLKHSVGLTTAGVSNAVIERPSAWLDHMGVELFPTGGDWALKWLTANAIGRTSSHDAGWGVVRTVGDNTVVADVKWVSPGRTFYLDATLGAGLLLDQNLVDYSEFANFDLASSAVQLIGGGSPITFVANTVNTPLDVFARLRRDARDAREDAITDIRRRLDASTAHYADMSPSAVIDYLLEEIGIGQLLTARAVGVSPTAVRKWRKGESTRPEHRSRLARFAALARLLEEVGPYDPAGWLDMPLSAESTLTPLDLFVAGRPELVLLRGSNNATPHETLDAFDAEWRATYAADPEYEVVTFRDGTRGAVPRREDKPA
jgi:hypothetical protein